MVCATCGHHGAPVIVTPGSIVIEMAAWLLFLVPGLIYSLWRLSARRMACESCGGASLMRPESPAGRRMMQSGG